MSTPPPDEDGFTLIELLIAAVLSVIITGVVGAAFIVTLKSTADTKTQLGESHDAQLVAAYLPNDLQSVGGASSDVDTSAGAASGCSGPPTDARNVVRLSGADSTVSNPTYYVADYRVVQTPTEWRLVRFACQATSSSGLAAAPLSSLVVAHNIKPVTSAADLPAVAVGSTKLTMTVTNATGYRYDVTAYRRTPSSVSTPTPTPAPTLAPPQAIVSSVQLFDDDAAGGMRIEVVFTLGLAPGCGGRFQVTGLGGRGTWTSSSAATISGSKAVLDLGNQTATADTTSTGIVVALNGDVPACPAASFASSSVTDKAAPVIASVATTVPGSVAGKIQTGDVLTVTYSEPLVSPPAPTSVTEEGNNGSNNDRLALPGIFASSADLGRTDYITDNHDAVVPATTGTSGAVSTITLGAYTCTGSSCPTLSAGGGSQGVLTFVQANGLMDAAGNALTSSSSPALVARTVPTFRAF